MCITDPGIRCWYGEHLSAVTIILFAINIKAAEP